MAIRVQGKGGNAESNAPITAILELNERLYQRLYSKADWNAIKRGALFAGGAVFVEKYLKLRFTRYALVLGYIAKKAKDPTRGMPLVADGDMQTVALARARPVATSTATRSTLEVRVPLGHGLRPSEAKVMNSTRQNETDAMAKEIEAEMGRLIQGSSVKTIERGVTAGQQRRSLTGEQRATVPRAEGHMKKPKQRPSVS